MEGTLFDTPTLAELFVKQGKPARAVGIYRKVVQTRPHDLRSVLRLRELERQVGTPGTSMTFREHMQRIVESVPGATACALMGFDGIAIDTYEVGGSALDIPMLLTEYASAAQSLRHSGMQQPLAGPVAELLIATTNVTAILRPLNEEYFLAMVLGPDGLSGKARYIMRLAAPELLRDLT
jgi:predicted regulator of Ras-like GTPase activity (Roadblock/LC7/MglB family)